MMRRILVVGGDGGDGGLGPWLVGQIHRLGHEVQGVSYWAQARPLIEEGKPDLVILDGHPPDAQGIDLLSRIGPLVPVIVLTADASAQSAVRAIRRGAVESLAKPVDPEQLELVIRRVLDMAALRRENQLLRGRLAAAADSALLDLSAEPSLEEIKRRYLKLLLERHGGHRGKVARALGISERNTYRLIRKFDLGEC